MFIDSRTVGSGERIRCDLCIVGAGPAGITLARSLADTGSRIVLLESGGTSADPRTQSLYAGRGRGLAEDRYLEESRLRFLGGTSNHWNGFCAPLDPIDFEERPWVPHSGWPIWRETLVPYYERAQALLGLGAFAYDVGSWLGDDHERAHYGCPGLVGGVWQVSNPPVRFGARYEDELRRAPSLHVYLHANALRLETDAAASHVTRVEVATLAGDRFSVAARTFVLACGGIENARLLLLSDRHAPGGLGNRHDRVGRFFMEHLDFLGERSPGIVRFAPGHQPAQLYTRRGTRLLPNLRPSVPLQRRERLLNGAFHLDRLVASPQPLGPEVARILAAESASPQQGLLAFVYCHLEQAPNPESRVTLGSETDALGMRRVVLDWRPGALDRDSLRRTLALLVAELGAAGVARVQIARWLDRDGPLDWSRTGVRGASHHMGTTRMSGDPRHGVVDRDGRVHGVENLFVAGSSVFPTVGWANPTLTILALCLRLADHLRARLADGSPTAGGGRAQSRPEPEAS